MTGKTSTPLLLNNSVSNDIRKTLAYGALICSVYSILQLIINGVVLDEVVTAAQIITGDVTYPAGHPHRIYYRQAYSLWNYLAAGIWSIIPDASFISALRNLLFCFLSTYAPFALTVTLTRQAVWGFAAVALTVLNTVVPFGGVYPAAIFPPPSGFTHGAVGMGFAILMVTFMLNRMWGSAGLLLGLSPALHASYAVVIWLWTGCYFLSAGNRQRFEGGYRFAFGAIASLLACGLLAGIIYFIKTNEPGAVAPYNITGDGEVIQQNFMAMSDSHRRTFNPISLGYTVAPVLFVMLSTLLFIPGRRQTSEDTPSRGNLFWVAVLGALCWILAYAAWLFQFFNGSLPAYVDSIMPFRFSGLAALLLIPLALTAQANIRQEMTETIRNVASVLVAGLIAGAGLYLIAQQTSPFSLNESLISNNLFLAVSGILAAMYVLAYRSRKMRLVVILLLFGLLCGSVFLTAADIGMALSAPAAFVISITLLYLASNLPGRLANKKLSVALICICLVAMSAALPRKRASDDRGPLKQWLLQNARSGEMLLPPVSRVSLLQAKVGHPILLKGETLMQMSYMTQVAPVVGMMVKDLYGIDFSDREHLNQIGQNGKLPIDSPAWYEALKHRTPEEWRMLGRKYSFRLVLSPKERPLKLKPAFEGSRGILYVIPDVKPL